MPDLALAALLNGGPLVLTVVSIIRGWLIPSATHLREIGYLERTIATQERTIAERDRQIDALLGRAREPAP